MECAVRGVRRGASLLELRLAVHVVALLRRLAAAVRRDGAAGRAAHRPRAVRRVSPAPPSSASAAGPGVSGQRCGRIGLPRHPGAARVRRLGGAGAVVGPGPARPRAGSGSDPRSRLRSPDGRRTATGRLGGVGGARDRVPVHRPHRCDVGRLRAHALGPPSQEPAASAAPAPGGASGGLRDGRDGCGPAGGARAARGLP